MKRLFVVFLAVVFGITFVSIVRVQSATETAPVPEKMETKAAPKATLLRYGGEVTAIDMAGSKTLTLKGKKGDMTFDMTSARMMEEPKVGESIMVQYTKKDGKMVADSVVGAMVPRKVEKKDMKPAPAK